jgi:hypothetical protein
MPVHVYVVNQDEQGVAVLLFPLPGQKLTNPLPAGALHRLPGLPVTGSEPLYWQVTTAAGRERFFVFASPARQASLEATLAALPRPQLNAPVIAVPLSEEAIGALRSVGGLVKADPKSSDVTSGLAFSFATPLLDTAEQTRGFWAREISFENPVPDTPRGRR